MSIHGPADPNITAFKVVQVATGNADCAENEAKKHVNHTAQLGGLIGEKTRAEKLTSDEQTAIAKKAAQVRWANES